MAIEILENVDDIHNVQYTLSLSGGGGGWGFLNNLGVPIQDTTYHYRGNESYSVIIYDNRLYC